MPLPKTIPDCPCGKLADYIILPDENGRPAELRLERFRRDMQLPSPELKEAFLVEARRNFSELPKETRQQIYDDRASRVKFSRQCGSGRRTMSARIPLGRREEGRFQPAGAFRAAVAQNGRRQPYALSTTPAPKPPVAKPGAAA